MLIVKKAHLDCTKSYVLEMRFLFFGSKFSSYRSYRVVRSEYVAPITVLYSRRFETTRDSRVREFGFCNGNACGHTCVRGENRADRTGYSPRGPNAAPRHRSDFHRHRTHFGFGAYAKKKNVFHGW